MSSDLGVIWRGILARGACCKLVLRLLCAYNNHILFTSRGCFSSAWTAPSASALTLNKPRNIDRSHSAPMRAAAAAALLQFLLDYPLGSGRLRGHVQFLLSNTAYEHESGRLQALEMLQQVRRLAGELRLIPFYEPASHPPMRLPIRLFLVICFWSCSCDCCCPVLF